MTKIWFVRLQEQIVFVSESEADALKQGDRVARALLGSKLETQTFPDGGAIYFWHGAKVGDTAEVQVGDIEMNDVVAVNNIIAVITNLARRHK
jgi:hypothetical protein